MVNGIKCKDMGSPKKCDNRPLEWVVEDEDDQNKNEIDIGENEDDDDFVTHDQPTNFMTFQLCSNKKTFFTKITKMPVMEGKNR